MPPKIALFSTLLIIFCLLIYDQLKNNKLSWELWLPLIWFMILQSRFVGLWFLDPSTQFEFTDLEEGNSFDRNLFLAFIILGIMILIKRQVKNQIIISKLFKENALLMILFTYMFISIFWSDYTFIALKRYIKAFGNLVMIGIIITESDQNAAIKAIFRRTAYLLIPLSIVLIKYYPEYGRHYHRFTGELFVTGVSTNKNGLGCLCAISGIYLSWELITSSSILFIKNNLKIFVTNIVYLILTLWLLMMSRSATSLMIFYIAVIIIFLLKVPFVKQYINYIGLYIVITIILIIILNYSIGLVNIIITGLGKDPTLTGRTILWDELFRLVNNRWIGCGYGSFWLGDKIEYLWSLFWWQPTEAHNGYIETYIELGFFGLTLLLIFLGISFKKIIKNLSTDFTFTQLKLSLFTVILLYNVTEAAFKGLHAIWFTLLLVSMQYNSSDKILNTSSNIY